ncbi:MAG: GPW/gp25 family protein [Candidatus Sedimenticola sp. 6PFRAG7]
MNAQTGQSLSGLDHLRQSITDILTTPVGSRVMRREYGSRLFELVDAPGNPGTLIDLYAATAVALARWEPRFRLARVHRNGVSADGRTSITLEGRYLPEGRDIVLEGVEL